MSLLHKASRHSRSSASITSQLLSATYVSPSTSLGPPLKKANGGAVTLKQQIGAPAGERLPGEPHLAEIVGVEAEQQPVAAIGGQRKDVAGGAEDRHFRSDGDDRRLAGEVDAAGLIGRDFEPAFLRVRS